MRNDIEYVRGLESRLEELRTAADLADAGYRDEIASLRLTDEEREALERVSVAYDLLPTEGARQIAATLRGLLQKLS